MLKVLSILCLVLAVIIGYNFYQADLTSEALNLDNISYKMGAKYTAFVLGGSGAVGKAIVRALAETPEFEKVTLIGRRQIELPESNEKSNFGKFDQKVMDFENISEYGDLFKGYDIGFYTIGVSSASVSEEEYKKVELHNALAIANLIKDAAKDDLKHLHWVSGTGAGKKSLFLFGRVKAQVEEEVTNMGFRRVSIYRPGGILTSDGSGMMGPKTQTLFKAVDFGNCMTIDGDLLGKAIVANSFRETDNKAEILENKDINKIGKNLPK